MKTRLFALCLACWCSLAIESRADPLMVPVTPQDLCPMSHLAEAQSQALAQGKPIGFLLTWPVYFPGAPGFLRVGSVSTTFFYDAFKDQAVLVNVDHSTGELAKVPKVALDAFHSPAEGGYAPCLCLVDPTMTKLIAMIPLWHDPRERNQLFAQYKAVIADKSRWGEGARTKPAPDRPDLAPAVAAAPTPRALASTLPSNAFKEEMELTLAAERAQQKQATPAPTP